MSLKRITYMSKFSYAIPREELDQIATLASVNNKKYGITGVLFTIGDSFYQMIEGEEKSLDELYNRIEKDTRHKDIVCIRTEKNVNTRHFPNWSMHTINLDKETGDIAKILKIMLSNITDSHAIIECYTQPSVSRLMRLGLNPLQQPSQRAHYVVMFSDIVGFTHMSNECPIDDVIELVNTALNLCSGIIENSGGEISKFMGDGYLAYWPANRADNAIKSALECLHALQEIRQSAPRESLLHKLYMGIGLSSGILIEGNIGSKVKTDFTIMGSAVNLASRVEAETRKVQKALLLTDQVLELTAENWKTHSVGSRILSGLTEETELFTLQNSITNDFPERLTTT